RDIVQMGAGFDTLVVNWSGIGYDVNTGGFGSADDGHSGAYFFRFDGGRGDLNRVDFSGVDRFDVTGGAANDTLVTVNGNDTLRGGAGSDTLIGGGGDDTY